MGAFESIAVTCPYCGKIDYLQSKSGPCENLEFDLANVPLDVASDFFYEGGVRRCYTCKKNFILRGFPSREAMPRVNITVEKYPEYFTSLVDLTGQAFGVVSVHTPDSKTAPCWRGRWDGTDPLPSGIFPFDHFSAEPSRILFREGPEIEALQEVAKARGIELDPYLFQAWYLTINDTHKENGDNEGSVAHVYIHLALT